MNPISNSTKIINPSVQTNQPIVLASSNNINTSNTNAIKFYQNKISQLPHKDLNELTNQELHKLAQEYGHNARKWQKSFAALLPEIEKRQLYKHYKCHTVYEYAAKLCGMSQTTVDEILNVHSKLKDKPVLTKLMGQQGWSKLKVVASIATTDSQNFWAEKVEQMSKNTLTTFVQELRKQGNLQKTRNKKDPNSDSNNENFDDEHPFKNNLPINFQQTDLFTNSTNIEGLDPGICNQMAVSPKEAMTIRLKPETETKLRIFKQKLEKQTRQPQDWNAAIDTLLQSAEREAELSKQHEKCLQKKKMTGKLVAQRVAIKTVDQKIHSDFTTASSALNTTMPVPKPTALAPSAIGTQKIATVHMPATKPATRHIPAAIQKIPQQKYKGRCAYPNCKFPAEIKHHTLRFALNPNHNPNFIAPLCKNHERLAHLGLIKFEDLSPDLWQIQLQPDKNTPKYWIDLKVNCFRRPKV